MPQLEQVHTYASQIFWLAGDLHSATLLHVESGAAEGG